MADDIETVHGNVSIDEIGHLGPTSLYILRYHGQERYGGPFTFVCSLMTTYEEGTVSGALGAYNRDTRRALEMAFREIGIKQVHFTRLNSRGRREKSLTK